MCSEFGNSYCFSSLVLAYHQSSRSTVAVAAAQSSLRRSGAGVIVLGVAGCGRALVLTLGLRVRGCGGFSFGGSVVRHNGPDPGVGTQGGLLCTEG